MKKKIIVIFAFLVGITSTVLNSIISSFQNDDTLFWGGLVIVITSFILGLFWKEKEEETKENPRYITKTVIAMLALTFIFGGVAVYAYLHPKESSYLGQYTEWWSTGSILFGYASTAFLLYYAVALIKRHELFKKKPYRTFTMLSKYK